MARFENQMFKIAHAGRHGTTDGLSGWRCKSCDEVVLDPEGAQRYAAAGDAMVLQARSG
jgi:HTH-type transcriptional regulator/antitoxin MqsA